MYEVKLSPAAQRAYYKLRGADFRVVDNKLEALKSDARPAGCLKLSGVDNQWRVRAGRFRVVYSIFDHDLLIWVLDIDDRKDVYRKRRR